MCGKDEGERMDGSDNLTLSLAILLKLKTAALNWL